MGQQVGNTEPLKILTLFLKLPPWAWDKCFSPSSGCAHAMWCESGISPSLGDNYKLHQCLKRSLKRSLSLWDAVRYRLLWRLLMTPHLGAGISAMACELMRKSRSTHYTVLRVSFNVAKSSNKQRGDLQTASVGLRGGHYNLDENTLLTLQRVTNDSLAEELRIEMWSCRERGHGLCSEWVSQGGRKS